MNISEKHKAFLWMMAKTASIHCSQVFALYGFETRGRATIGNALVHNHATVIPENSSDYTFICTARNPFERYLSWYKFNNKNPSLWSPSHFRNYFYKNQGTSPKFLWPFNDRLPDYFIRTEHLWRDYNEIPFIRNSKFNKSGALYDFCQTRINSTPPLPNPEKYYTTDMIDFFLTNGKKYFDLLNYSYPY